MRHVVLRDLLFELHVLRVLKIDPLHELRPRVRDGEGRARGETFLQRRLPAPVLTRAPGEALDDDAAELRERAQQLLPLHGRPVEPRARGEARERVRHLLRHDAAPSARSAAEISLIDWLTGRARELLPATPVEKSMSHGNWR